MLRLRFMGRGDDDFVMRVFMQTMMNTVMRGQLMQRSGDLRRKYERSQEQRQRDDAHARLFTKMNHRMIG